MREMTTVTEHTIDIDRILKGKMGAKAKFVPRLLVDWLKRIAHQDQVNAFLWESRDKEGVEWLEECVKYLDMTLNIVGKENLPDPADGKLYTFVSNHPLGGEDGVALGAIIGRFYEGRFRYLVNDLLMNLPGLAPLCIPINKTGNQSRNFPAMVEAGFRSDHHMLMFPAGICSRKRGGVIKDLPWKRPLSRRVLNTSATLCQFISVAKIAGFSIVLLTSVTNICHLIWRCCFLSMKCIKMCIRRLRLRLVNLFPGRLLISRSRRWNGRNL